MPIIVSHILKYNIAYRVMIGRHILQLGGWVGWSWHLVPKILASLQWIQITSPPPPIKSDSKMGMLELTNGAVGHHDVARTKFYSDLVLL